MGSDNNDTITHPLPRLSGLRGTASSQDALTSDPITTRGPGKALAKSFTVNHMSV